VKATCSICSPWKKICPPLQKDEGDGGEESEFVPGSSIDKEGEAGACELDIRYPTLQAIYAGKLNRQSIQVISITFHIPWVSTVVPRQQVSNSTFSVSFCYQDCVVILALPEQSKPGRIFQHLDRL
jgi:hypothetical protein